MIRDHDLRIQAMQSSGDMRVRWLLAAFAVCIGFAASAQQTPSVDEIAKSASGCEGHPDAQGSGNDGSEEDISLTVIQPFVNYNFGGGWYVSSAPIITANWEADNDDEWTIPLGGGVGRVFHSGKQAINARMAYYNVEKPRFGAQWDFQLTFTLMYPKKIGNG